MALSATISTSVSANAQAAYARGGTGRTNRVKGNGRRGLLLSAVVAATQVNDSETELLKKYLKKSEENKAKNDKRLESYYKRNYRDYFGVLEGTLKQKKEGLTESEKGILEWLEKNK